MNSKDLYQFMSQSEELADYEIGEDNEGQLIIYTGLYRVPRKNPDDEDTWRWPGEEEKNESST